jgi:hypothetical protein
LARHIEDIDLHVRVLLDVKHRDRTGRCRAFI